MYICLVIFVFKNIPIFLAVYLFAIFLVPCHDAWEIEKINNKQNIEKASCDAAHEKDDCSPFCSCNCCSMSVMVNPIVHFSLINFYSWADNFTPYQSSHSTFHHSIWQPPKLG